MELQGTENVNEPARDTIEPNGKKKKATGIRATCFETFLQI